MSTTEPAIQHSPLPVSRLRCSRCPACGHEMAVDFYWGGKQPLSTLAWPADADEARTLKTLPLTFVRCLECGHIYNRRFRYREVPYTDKQNLMFNRGPTWQQHLAQTVQVVVDQLPRKPVVIEVGCGDGHLLRRLAEARPDGRYVGFDPSPAAQSTGPAVCLQQRLFDPLADLAVMQPDIILARHVLEHLANPRAFLQSLALASSWAGHPLRLFLEVPCIETALRQRRTVDFFYEHPSHFTRHSLSRMLITCGAVIERMDYAYRAEVLWALASFSPRRRHVRGVHRAAQFRAAASRNDRRVREALAALASGGSSIAIWGGTGKAATFINRYRLDSQRFPLVVDSDPRKVGSFVPGMGQEIRPPEYLRDHPVDVIVIATQWRAPDIIQEINRRSIACTRILLEHNGALVESS